jgi:protein TonB
MKNLKKLPTKQLEKFSTIFTQLGLVLVLFIVYVTLEHETKQSRFIVESSYEPTTIFVTQEQDILISREPKIQPIVEPPRNTIFLIDEPIEQGDNDIIEAVIDLPTEKVVPINPEDIIEVAIPVDDEPETVPFMMIQNAPVFKGCEGLSKEDNKICFDKKMKRFVQRNFNSGLANEVGLNSGKYKIQTQFIIDNKGNVVDIKIRAPHTRLKKEMQRLIEKLPKFTPGLQRNKPVQVRYTLPISFQVD